MLFELNTIFYTMKNDFGILNPDCSSIVPLSICWAFLWHFCGLVHHWYTETFSDFYDIDSKLEDFDLDSAHKWCTQYQCSDRSTRTCIVQFDCRSWLEIPTVQILNESHVLGNYTVFIPATLFWILSWLFLSITKLK